MNILYTINDGFVPQAAAGITSICENNKSAKEITFYIIGQQVSEDNKNELDKLAKSYGRKFVLIELDDLSKYIDFEFDTTGWNPIVLARLLMGQLLPKDVDRVLYLDGDTIVLEDLSKLWNRNLHGKVLGMVAEPTVNRKRKDALGLHDYYYHNAGVLLVDLKRWREKHIEKVVLEYYKENDGKLFANDQDAINASLKDEIVELLPKYNFSNIYTTYPYWFIKMLVKPRKYISRKLYEESMCYPAIIHYLGEERPWRKGNTHMFKDEYKKYLKMTKWADTPDEEGWTLYFVAWRIFNTVMKPFPMVRYWIIDALIPVVLKMRAKKRK